MRTGPPGGGPGRAGKRAGKSRRIRRRSRSRVVPDPSAAATAGRNAMHTTKNTLAASLAALALALAAMAAFTTLRDAQAAPPKPTALDKMVLDCGDSEQFSLTLNVCAGPSGAPAGFSVQWMTKDAYVANGEMWYLSDDPRLCKASFSGVANAGYQWRLPGSGEGQCVEIPIGGLQDLADTPSLGVSTNCGGALECNTAYVFRAFAHNVPQGLNKGPFSDTVTCTTAPCEGEACCMLSHGYYKHQCDIGVSYPDLILPCGTLHVCAELGNLYNGPGVENARGRLGHQIIAVSLSLAACNGGTGPGPNDPAQALLNDAIEEYCSDAAT
ncbi:hypothetical protein HK102_011782, partial [Quaeritorhiza haematococci]